MNRNCNLITGVPLLKRKFNIFSFFIFILMKALSSCAPENDQVVCTMEWRTVTITVNRPPLDSFYTLREATGDTIRLIRDNIPGSNDYPVLTDSYQPVLQGQTGTFRFLGFMQDSVTVNDAFVIGADRCHIYYVSGNQVVN